MLAPYALCVGGVCLVVLIAAWLRWRRKGVLIAFTILGVTAISGVFFLWKGALVSNPRGYATLGDVPVPRGFVRVDAPAGSEASYSRGLPLKGKGAKIKLYTGGDADLQCFGYAVLDDDILSNYEQCADVCMRIRAEYLFANRRYGEIRFMDCDSKWQVYTGGADRKAFEKFMKRVYGVASTYSLSRSLETRALTDVQPGDILVYPSRLKGHYGHAVYVADVAHGSGGKVALMIVEGNTPARSKHVLRNVLCPTHPAWFVLDSNVDPICVWPILFKKDELKHW